MGLEAGNGQLLALPSPEPILKDPSAVLEPEIHDDKK